jgi:HEAT repeat protein
VSPPPGEEPARRPPPSLADLVVPRRPSGVSYRDGDDVDARALLEANGYTLETGELVDLLQVNLGLLQAAAARMLGAAGQVNAAGALRLLALDEGSEETARVQAAYALARLGLEQGEELLAELLAIPPESSPAPMQASGALARLGDPRGFQVILTALDSANPVTAMVGCKQLYAFAPLDGATLPEGGRVDLYAAYRRALERPEALIGGEARAQLAELDTDPARELLAEYPAPSR